MNRLGKLIWKFNYAIYPSLRDFILSTHLWKHSGRQPFYIGRAENRVSTENVSDILKDKGFERSICSWVDEGEVLSMRKQDGKYQYHVRYFSDGELRGHFEYLPESAPIKHLLERLVEPKTEYFKQIFEKVLLK